MNSGDIMAVKQVSISDEDDKAKKSRENALVSEMTLLSTLDHPNIVRYFGMVSILHQFIPVELPPQLIQSGALTSHGRHLNIGHEVTETFYNVFLEYVPGGSISSALSKYGKFDQDLSRSLTYQILCGLQYLHDG